MKSIVYKIACTWSPTASADRQKLFCRLQIKRMSFLSFYLVMDVRKDMERVVDCSIGNNRSDPVT